MSAWKTVETERDIEDLLERYYGFHDACIVSALYNSGMRADGEGTMHHPDADGHRMTVGFQSQWVHGTLELLFLGVRQAHIVGWEDNYSRELFDATLTFVHDLLPGEPKRLVVWAGCGGFDAFSYREVLREPADSYIIANELRWRLVE